jgi:hypothetical protein
VKGRKMQITLSLSEKHAKPKSQIPTNIVPKHLPFQFSDSSSPQKEPVRAKSFNKSHGNVRKAFKMERRKAFKITLRHF